MSQPLPARNRKRAIDRAHLIRQLETMLQESGNPRGFNVARWLSRWLAEPLPAFGGKHPVDFMNTSEGRALVSETLAMMQSGAYA